MLDHNFPAFHRQAKELRDLGHTVFNPAENVGENGGGPTEEAKKGRPYFMRLDIFMIVGTPDTAPVDAIAVLPDWHLSRGARLEVEIGLQLDLPILWAHTLKPLSRADLEIARQFQHREYLLPNYCGVPA